MKEVKLVQQPTNDSCVSACLAMVTGLDIETVYNEFHDPYYVKRNQSIHRYAAEKGVDLQPAYTCYNSLAERGVYLVTVPSLNIVGGLHEIVVDTRDGFINVYDPVRDGRYRYVSYADVTDCGPLEVQLKSWLIDYRVMESKHLGIK